MALRLTVQRAAWQAHVDAIAASVDGLVPVVKGNGYGFGRPTLHPLIKGWRTTSASGRSTSSTTCASGSRRSC